MYSITCRNVNDGFRHGAKLLKKYGVPGPSRVGNVIEIAEPVSVCYQLPEEAVLFNPIRDANPFFHLYEAMWMIWGGKHLAQVERYLPRMKEFSDDGKLMQGAYGYRWRSWFADKDCDMDGPWHLDQLTEVIELLGDQPETRRAVLQMWDCEHDLVKWDSKDIPCNTEVYFWIRDNKLHMRVNNRSNDIVWGLFGANAVQFSILQQYVAGKLELPIGYYWQITSNFHAYPERHNLDDFTTIVDCPYADKEVEYQSLIDDHTTFDMELDMIMKGLLKYEEREQFNNRFLGHTLLPVMETHRLYKEGDSYRALLLAHNIEAPDWGRACFEWIQRRIT